MTEVDRLVREKMIDFLMQEICHPVTHQPLINRLEARDILEDMEEERLYWEKEYS